jgi:uncharacterized membrane protein
VERIASDVAGQPPRTKYQALLGWHAPRIRRVAIAGAAGVLLALALLPWVDWQLAILLGWDLGAIVFLVPSWVVIARSDVPQTQKHATLDDETRVFAAVIVLGASLASLFAVGFTLGAAGRAHGGDRVGLIALSFATVLLSWTVVNTVFTLRYADLHFQAGSGIEFGSPPDEAPDYRDFAYVAFTIGMCYQVSDTTLRDRKVRRTALAHAVISYVFGVVIIAAGINLVAGLIQ